MTLPLVKRKKRKIKWCKHGVNKQKSAVKTIENNTLLIKICPKTRQVNTSFKNKFLTNNELIIQKGGKARKYSINKVFVRMFLRFRIMRYGTGYAIPHFLSRE